MNLKSVKIKGIRLTVGFFNLIVKFFKKIISQLNVLLVYWQQEECTRYTDCQLLGKIIENQPNCPDRGIEYPWALRNIHLEQGRLLDVGSTASSFFFEFLPKSIEIYALDLNEQPIENKQIKFIKGDARKTDFPDNFFDYVTCISTLEHIGVEGRYHSDKDPDGDLKTIKEIHRILKHNGQVLVTIPYGKRDVLPINRLYNKERLEKMFNDFETEKKFMKFNLKYNLWLEVTEEEAAQTDMLRDKWYALALIKLTKK